jgi:hypothetical protein
MWCLGDPSTARVVGCLFQVAFGTDPHSSVRVPWSLGPLVGLTLGVGCGV